MKIICALDNAPGGSTVRIDSHVKYGVRDLDTGEYVEVLGANLLKDLSKNMFFYKNAVTNKKFKVYMEPEFKESLIWLSDTDIVRNTFSGFFRYNITQIHEKAYALEFEVGSIYVPIIMVESGYAPDFYETRVFLCGNRGHIIYWNYQDCLFTLNLRILIKEKVNFFSMDFIVGEHMGDCSGSEKIICSHELSEAGYKLNGLSTSFISKAWLNKVIMNTNFDDILHDKVWSASIS